MEATGVSDGEGTSIQERKPSRMGSGSQGERKGRKVEGEGSVNANEAKRE